MASELTAAIPLAAPSRGKRGVDRWLLVATPGLLFLVVFFGLPLGEIVWRSLTDPDPVSNYGVFLQVPVYFQTLLRTLGIAALTVLVTLALGYPFAYAMSRVGRRVAAFMLALVLLSIGTSFLVRAFALQILLQDTGVINTALRTLGLISEPLPLIRSVLGVALGMAQILLPFMILPIYNVLRRIDPELKRAAASLGASPWTAARLIIVPLSLPGVYAGALLVFVLSLGFFVVPALLGGPSSTMMSTLIVAEVQLKSDFGTASAIAVTLLVSTLAVLVIGSRFVRIRDVFGGAAR